MWSVATLVWPVNSAATVAFWSTVIFDKLEPSPWNDVATTAWPTKFLTVIAELLFAVAADADKVFTTATLCAWAEADVAPLALAVCADALNTATLAILSVWAEALKALSPATYSVLKAAAAELLNAESPATYSVLNAAAADELKLLFAAVAKPFIASLCVCAELLNAVSPALYSVLNAPAAELEYAAPNLFPILVAIDAEKFGSSFNAAASSSNVSNVAGAEFTIPATLASIYVFCDALKALSPATYSVLNAPALDPLNVLLAVVAKPLIASLWVWADALKALSPATYSVLIAAAAELLNALSPATYSALNAVAADDERLFTTAILWVWDEAEVAPPALAACADADNTLIFAILSECAELDKAVSPATYSVLNADAADELKLLFAAVASPFIASLWVWVDADKAAFNSFLLTSAELLNEVTEASVA